MKVISLRSSVAVAALLMAAATPALAAETLIGGPNEKNGLAVTAVYLQAVTMDPMSHGTHEAHGAPDIHLEADIKATKGNTNGFKEDDWVPYLNVDYTLEKIGGTYKSAGKLIPMVANDGPHYGENVKLDGPGKYKLTFKIASPQVNGFYRHTDKETGVAKWWEPYTETYEFTYVGSTGKKGGY